MLPNLKKYCKYEYVMYNSVFKFFLKKQFIKIYINNLLSIHYLDNRVIQFFALNVPDEGYSWNVLCAVNLISMFLFYYTTILSLCVSKVFKIYKEKYFFSLPWQQGSTTYEEFPSICFFRGCNQQIYFYTFTDVILFCVFTYFATYVINLFLIQICWEKSDFTRTEKWRIFINS
jgi:hypothetical protein